MQMDEVDQNQQREIEGLKIVDVKHDRDFWWIKALMIILLTWTIISGVVILHGMDIVEKAMDIIETKK